MYKFKKWWSEFYEEYAPIVIMISVLLLVISCLLGVALVSSYNSCNVYADMGIPTQWNFWTACMAEHPEFGWIPVDEYFKVLNLNVTGE